MKVSIVVPVYNAERYIAECIESALGQTYGNTEIIAVDDGSTDSSDEVLDGYADRIRVFRRPNGGTASALNYGRERMEGDWFKWLSADDMLKPHAVESLVRAADAAGRPEDHIFYAEFDHINEAGKKIGRYTRPEPDNNGKSDFDRNAILLHHFYGNAITSMFHRSIFKRCGPFDESIKFGEDYEFWLRCCLLHGCRLHLVKKNIARYRVHPSQLSSKRSDEIDANSDRIRSMVLEQVPVGLRGRYAEAAAQIKQPVPVSARIRAAAYRALFSCVPRPTAQKAIRAYHRMRSDGLYVPD